ncbi:MAG: hypothetical protein GXP35_04390 [Actinobacteria bacterium]|nr:hypothetical protein [Actinomycetota bacterium]
MRNAATLLVAFGLLAAACGGDSSEPDADAADETAATAPVESDQPSDTTQAAAETSQQPAGNAGSLVLGAETIEFDSARCFLEEQDAAGGGGKILFVAQAFGETAAGEPIVVDVSRYDEDSQFTGDDIIIDFGDPFSDDFVSMSARTDLGTVTVDGSSLSASGLTFVDSTDLAEQSGSFQINC